MGTSREAAGAHSWEWLDASRDGAPYTVLAGVRGGKNLHLSATPEEHPPRPRGSHTHSTGETGAFRSPRLDVLEGLAVLSS